MKPTRHAVAASLKRHREARAMSLSDLARASGVAKATLSQLEAGRANPTLDTLWALSTALRVSLGELVSEPARPAVVVRRREGTRVKGASVRARLVDQMATGAVRLECFFLEIARRRQTSAAHSPGVVEHLFVIGGRLRAGLASAPVDLETGDYLRLEPDAEHVYEALDGPARAILVMQFPRS